MYHLMWETVGADFIIIDLLDRKYGYNNGLYNGS